MQCPQQQAQHQNQQQGQDGPVPGAVLRLLGLRRAGALRLRAAVRLLFDAFPPDVLLPVRAALRRFSLPAGAVGERLLCAAACSEIFSLAVILGQFVFPEGRARIALLPGSRSPH